MFLSFHNVQNKQRGDAIHTLLRFLPTLAPCQARRDRRTVRGKTQLESTTNKRRSHSILALEQWISRWSIVSSSCSHKKHMFASGIPLLFSWSSVSTLPQDASQAKKPSLGGTIGFHMDQAGNLVEAECASFLYISLTEKPSDVDSFNNKQSSCKGLIFLLWRKCRNLSTCSTSQSLKGLKKTGDQPLSSLEESQTLATLVSL